MTNPSFCVAFNPQNPPVLLPLETACLAWDSPLSSVSGRKRYNTLDFASKIVCQQGYFSPLLGAQSQGIVSLWTPAYFPRKWYPNCKKCSLTPFLRKYKTTATSILHGDENSSGFSYPLCYQRQLRNCIVTSTSVCMCKYSSYVSNIKCKRQIIPPNTEIFQ